MEIRENIAKNITELRKRNHWTQAELAEKINYSDKAVSKWERGEAVPEIETLYALANIFGVTIDYFLYDDHDMQKQFVQPKVKNLFRKLAVLFLLSLSVVLIALIIFMAGHYGNWDNKSKLWMAFVWATPILATLTLMFFMTNKIWLGSLISSCLIVVFLVTCIYLELLVNELGQIWMIWLFVPLVVAAIILIFFMHKDRNRRVLRKYEKK